MKILKRNKKSHLDKNMFLDESVDIQRFDTLKYPVIDKLTEKQLGFFWRPEEVDVSKDKKDFDLLTDHEKHIFTSNLKRQILLDSVQGRAPNLSFLPIASLPEIENWIETWSFIETIVSWAPNLTPHEKKLYFSNKVGASTYIFPCLIPIITIYNPSLCWY